MEISKESGTPSYFLVSPFWEKSTMQKLVSVAFHSGYDMPGQCIVDDKSIDV